MKILFCGYRDWAKYTFFSLRKRVVELKPLQSKITHDDFCFIQTPEELVERVKNNKWDVIMTVGWSWKIPADIVNNNIVLGVHPSDLPAYAGGSPIQNQILDGVEKTNATLFRLNENFDEGQIVDKEPIDLTGHLYDVLKNIEYAALAMLDRFIRQFPNNTYTPQPKGGNKVKRLQPHQSKLELPFYPQPKTMTCKELWNFIRCREDPYPNAYFEDETGRLVIKLVEFEPK